MTSDFNEQRLNEGGPEAIRPEETLQGMSDDAIRTELCDTLEDMGITPPQGFSAARNEQVRAVMDCLTPYRADGGPLVGGRPRLKRILMLMLELRARELRVEA